jgi:uncharacterized surface protein with fasciclin (FAS1) repeats
MNRQPRFLFPGLLLAAALVVPALVVAADNPRVGGAAMDPTKDIVDNAVNSQDHTTLVAAVKAAGLVDTLKGPGPFTVFAPTDAAFAKLPAGTVDNLLKPANKDALVRILAYHVVAGNLDAFALRDQITAGHGVATLATVQGEPLTAFMKKGKITLQDAQGGIAWVTIPDVRQSNGIVHVINAVLMP